MQRQPTGLCGPPCISSPGGKVEKQACIPTILLHRHTSCKNPPGNKKAVHGIVYRGVEVRILLSARVIRCCETTSANFTLPSRRGRDKLAEMHLLRLSLLPATALQQLPHHLSSAAQRLGSPGRVDDDVSELRPVRGISAWGTRREMSF